MTRTSEVPELDDPPSDVDKEDPVPPLPWTGERFIPTEGGPEIYYEHAHRYLVARDLLAGHTVVDLASGEGYGAAWLAEVAESVIGLDIDRPSVEHARARYAVHENLEFAVGDVQSLPLADSCVDAVTCFEAIEHVENPRAVVEEIVRVLRPGGLLLVSTPNKAVYADERDYNNEFHVHEFYLPDLELLLGEYFAERDLLGQRVVAGSLTWRLEGDAPAGSTGGPGISIPPGFGEHDRREPPAMVEPMYVLAACRLAGAPRVAGDLPAGSMLVDPEELLLEVYRQASKPGLPEDLVARVRDQDDQLERARAQLAAYEEQAIQLRRRIRELNEQPPEGSGRFSEGGPEAQSIQTVLLGQQEIAARLRRDLDAATEVNLRLLAEIRAQQNAFARMQHPHAAAPRAGGAISGTRMNAEIQRIVLLLARRLPLLPGPMRRGIRSVGRRFSRWL
ncbi:MAG TPA: methyltransferase domain-containing protein [Acidimicrobiales bacterium]|nr:methyltransferase domain-containing protein [Acidimicrobiales bacterium]